MRALGLAKGSAARSIGLAPSSAWRGVLPPAARGPASSSAISTKVLSRTDTLPEGSRLGCISKIGGTWLPSPMPSEDLCRKFLAVMRTRALARSGISDLRGAFDYTFWEYDREQGDDSEEKEKYELLDWTIKTNEGERKDGFDWFKFFDPSTDPTLSEEDWASKPTGNMASFIKHVLRVTGGVIPSAISQVMARTASVGLTYRWGFSRHTVVRLFDRLNVNFTMVPGRDGGIAVSPVDWWFDAAGERHERRQTLVGVASELNAWRTFLSTRGEATLSLAYQIAVTDRILAMPLDWENARVLGLVANGMDSDPEPVLARLSDETLAGLEEAYRLLRDRDEDAILRLAEINYGLGWFRAMLTMRDGLGITIVETIAYGLKDLTEDGVPPWVDQLGDVAFATLQGLQENSVLANFVIDKQLSPPYDTAYADLSTAFSRSDMAMLTFGQHHVGIVEGVSAQTSEPDPVTGLRTVTKDAIAPLWNDLSPGTDSRIGDWVADGWGDAADAWVKWWNSARPTLDVALVIDAAAEALEQAIYLDDTLLAASGLSADEGGVGSGIRNLLYSKGLAWVSDVLGGVSPIGVVRYLFRQVLTDAFLSLAEQAEGIGRECLYPLFCWMDTKSKRDAIDAALGPTTTLVDLSALDSFARVTLAFLLESYRGGSVVGDALHETWGVIVGPKEPAEGEYAGWTIPVRAGLLGLFQGGTSDALNVIMGQVKAWAAQDEEPGELLEQLSAAQLGILRAWLRSARSSCLAPGLREALIPEQFFSSAETVEEEDAGDPVGGLGVARLPPCAAILDPVERAECEERAARMEDLDPEDLPDPTAPGAGIGP